MKKALTLSVIAIVALAVALPALAEDAPDGKALYASKCAMCHGADGVAKKMAEGSANLNDAEWQKKTPAETIEKDIHGGKGKMPKFEGKLTDEQIKAIAAYVKTLK
jgi:mono/diheme cytochrome c family protein